LAVIDPAIITMNPIYDNMNEDQQINLPSTPEPEVLEDIESGSSVKYSARVILYNDDFHSFDEVIEQLIKALNCSFSKANYLALKAHSEGKAVVFKGPYHKCIRVSSILEEIALRTEIVF
jgi:ATP-dependent Clp protease adapter protein ClpS